jgi:hypothetical protein
MQRVAEERAEEAEEDAAKRMPKRVNMVRSGGGVAVYHGIVA